VGRRDIFTEMGTEPLPGGEIVPALDRGLIDAAEFNNASSDRLLGFPTSSRTACCRASTRSGERSEILFNKSSNTPRCPRSCAPSSTPTRRPPKDMSWKAIERTARLHRAEESRRQVLQNA
jgi:TRAP-type mannitol/chloroaromatic compound transport system substrate-binding protein